MENKINIFLKSISGNSIQIFINLYDPINILLKYTQYDSKNSNKYLFFTNGKFLQEEISFAGHGINDGDTIVCLVKKNNLKTISFNNNSKKKSENVKFNQFLTDVLSNYMRKIDLYLTNIDINKNALNLYNQILHEEESNMNYLDNKISENSIISNSTEISSKPLPFFDFSKTSFNQNQEQFNENQIINQFSGKKVMKFINNFSDDFKFY